jgi:hypothetical protein
MGKIISRPKMPSISMPTLPTLAADTTPIQSNTDIPNGSGGSTDAPEVTADEQRVKNILTRNRGRLGTISTSFNGILNSDPSISPTRKTLLGE